MSTHNEKLLEEVKAMIKAYDKLPATAYLEPVTHYDLVSILLLLESFLGAFCAEAKSDIKD